MGAILQATGISTEQTIRSSIEHAGLAGNRCIEEAGVNRLDIGLMINVGIYRDQNMVEPGMAALIQKKLGLNLDYITLPVRKSAFSFDLMHGGIGALHAMRVAENYLQTDSTQHVLIIASEAHPSNRADAPFPYATLGSAMLLSKNSDASKGIQGFAFGSTPQAQIASTGFLKPMACGAEGRDALEIQVDARYAEQALAHALQLARPFMLQQNLGANETQLISSQLHAEFANQLCAGLELPASAALNLFPTWGDPFTSSFGLGLHQLRQQQATARQLLFVGVSSGLTAACVHYAL